MHFLDKLFGRKNTKEDEEPIGIPLYIPPANNKQNETQQALSEKNNAPIAITKHSDIPQLEMTFQEAQKAGFQFRYRKARRHKTTVIITRIHIRDVQLIIPAKINGYEVQRIATKYNVKVDKNLPEVKLYLPDTVKFIEERAFTYCRPLSTVYFPVGHINIGANAFDWLRNLKELHFGKSAAIGSEAFRYCKGLESVELEYCSFGKGAFYGCENLKTVIWKELDKRCGDAVFYNTPFEKSQELLILSDVLQKYNGNAKTFTVPDGIKTIGEDAFYNCRTLEEVILPPTVRNIEKSAFLRCENLKKINLENVFNINKYAFWGCSSFGGDIHFHQNVRFYNDPFSDSSLLGKELTTPDGIVINGTLTTMGNNFVDDVWTIREGIRRISIKYETGDSLNFCYGKTVILPRSLERVETLDCFWMAKRIVIKNPKMLIFCSTNLAYCKDLTLCFETDEGMSEFVFYYPKWQKDNPVYVAVYKLYTEFFKSVDQTGIYYYDHNILQIGLTYRQMLDIAYRRLTGGFMLHEKNRRMYMDFVHTHRKKGLRYATERNDTAQIEFFTNLF